MLLIEVALKMLLIDSNVFVQHSSKVTTKLK